MAHSIKDQVAVIGVGCIKFGDNFDQGYEEMAVEAAFAAFNDAKITPEEIDAAWLGTWAMRFLLLPLRMRVAGSSHRVGV